MPIIQITNTYKDAVLDIVKSCVPSCFQIRTLSENSVEALEACIEDADYLLASGRVQINQRVLNKAKKLKMIQRTGVGLDSLDLHAIKKANIPLYVNQGVNAQSVAEHTILLILACLRKLTLIDQNSKNGIWQKQSQGITTFELNGKTVGVVGMGNIGKKVASILNSFGANVIYFDQYRLKIEQEQELYIQYMKIEDLFSNADIVTLHCPLTEQTRKIISEESLHLMKENVIIVNTARGELIDEGALLKAIDDRKVSFAGLDVHTQEPFSRKNKLITSNHVIATPHIGGVTYDAFYRMMKEAVHNIVSFEEGKLENIKDKRVYIPDQM